MYLRAVHAEFDIPRLRKFIRENPLGIFITSLQSENFPSIQCTHLPWLLDVSDEESDTELGILRGHMAKANPHSKAIAEDVQKRNPSNGSLEKEVCVLFNGPVHSYVTPKFYVETKPKTGKVVPTWNYSAVQVYGKATFFFDTKNAETGSYLQQQISDLTKHAETSIMDYTGGNNPDAWEVTDAPTPFVEILKKSIMGIEIKIDRLEGKWKMNQEMGKEDRAGVVQGFENLGTDSGNMMAQTVQTRGAMKDPLKAAQSSEK